MMCGNPYFSQVGQPRTPWDWGLQVGRLPPGVSALGWEDSEEEKV